MACVFRHLKPFALPLLILFCCLVVFIPTSKKQHVSTDVIGSSLASWRIATTGEPWLDDIAPEVSAIHEKLNADGFLAENGHVVPTRSPGVVALGVPAYWVQSSGTSIDDFDLVPQAITAAVLSALAVVLFYLAIRPRLSTPTALASAGALAFTTPVWAVASDALWTHSVTIVGLAGMAWAASRDRWWLLGLFGGIGLWGRLHIVVIVAALGLGISLARRNPFIAARVALVSATFLGLASLWSHWLYGRWSPSGGYSGTGYREKLETGFYTDLSSQIANQLGLWISPDRGLLVWSPIIVVLLPALARSWRSLPDWSRWLLVGGVAYTLIQGRFSPFMGGDGFYAYRLMLEMLLCAAPALALSTPRLGSWEKRLIGPVVGLQLGAMIVGAVMVTPFLRAEDAWTDNALVRTAAGEPLVMALSALGLLIGVLAAISWRERGFTAVSLLDSAGEQANQCH